MSSLYPISNVSNVGITLLNNASELIKTMDEMRSKKDFLKTQILEDEEEKIKIESELAILTERLEKTNGKLPK